jgi:hypothetical protein
MYVKLLDIKGSWRHVADTARTTVNMPQGEGEPPSLWKKKMLLAEHSPIRKLILAWKWIDIKYWISVHFVRHKFGIEHFVRSQRDDRTGIPRDDLPQSSLVDHECEANAQAIINISRKRLCRNAHIETREAWQKFLDTVVKPYIPELYEVCVPDCVYRGWCYEINSCGYFRTYDYHVRLLQYRKNINSNT